MADFAAALARAKAVRACQTPLRRAIIMNGDARTAMIWMQLFCLICFCCLVVVGVAAR